MDRQVVAVLIGVCSLAASAGAQSSLPLSVDQRVRVAYVTAESTLTRDTVPVSVDAIVFWVVWSAEKSILEVQNFNEAITMSAQTIAYIARPPILSSTTRMTPTPFAELF